MQAITDAGYDAALIGEASAAVEAPTALLRCNLAMPMHPSGEPCREMNTHSFLACSLSFDDLPRCLEFGCVFGIVALELVG